MPSENIKLVKYKNTQISIEAHDILAALAALQNRSMKNCLETLIRKAYAEQVGEIEDNEI